MNCGVCRYPNESRIEYFQTPQLRHRVNEHALKLEEWRKWTDSLNRPNVPEDYGMKNESYKEYNSQEEHLMDLFREYPQHFDAWFWAQAGRAVSDLHNKQLMTRLREMMYDQFDPAI